MHDTLFSLTDLIVLLIGMETFIFIAKIIAKNIEISILKASVICFLMAVLVLFFIDNIQNLLVYNKLDMLSFDYFYVALIITAFSTLGIYAERKSM